MTIFAHRLLSFVWRQQSNRKGANPANGIAPNFLRLKNFYRTAIICFQIFFSFLMTDFKRRRLSIDF